MWDDDDRADCGAALAGRHARDLLDRLGVTANLTISADHPALAWRRAGLMAITGRPEASGLIAPVALTAAADGALAALRALAPVARLPTSGAQLLGERARLLGLVRRGRTSANGSCRLLAARHGEIALNLPRRDDWELVPAWLCKKAGDWGAIERRMVTRDSHVLVERGRLLGLAIARSETPSKRAEPFTITHKRAPRKPVGRPIVVDLSALWAGPLAGALLQAAGARVIKVESVRRPDGARGGNAAFFDLLNANKASVVLDFTDATDVRHLQRLVYAADIVIDNARPRALAHLGIDAAAVARRGATWLSITAYGRSGRAADWIGFGDDAAVAGGLSAAMARHWGEALFAGDAIADPLTGITAALAGWASWQSGAGGVVSLALADVVAHACRLHETRDVSCWQAIARGDTAPLYPLRTAPGPARAFGADTAAILGAGEAKLPPKRIDSAWQ